ncbi:hypothetical protein HKX48_001890 [Thoreauomyces humboldtii]|nr:hypothetical protein HKX48_001890 [Thoreauomyces humboldtii]
MDPLVSLLADITNSAVVYGALQQAGDKRDAISRTVDEVQKYKHANPLLLEELYTDQRHAVKHWENLLAQRNLGLEKLASRLGAAIDATVAAKLKDALSNTAEEVKKKDQRLAVQIEELRLERQRDKAERQWIEAQVVRLDKELSRLEVQLSQQEKDHQKAIQQNEKDHGKALLDLEQRLTSHARYREKTIISESLAKHSQLETSVKTMKTDLEQNLQGRVEKLRSQISSLQIAPGSNSYSEEKARQTLAAEPALAFSKSRSTLHQPDGPQSHERARSGNGRLAASLSPCKADGQSKGSPSWVLDQINNFERRITALELQTVDVQRMGQGITRFYSKVRIANSTKVVSAYTDF